MINGDFDTGAFTGWTTFETSKVYEMINGAKRS